MSSTFSPTTAELALVSLIFDQGDPQKHGILTGDVAVKVFAGAKLEPNILGDIWSIADEHNNGWLPKKGVAIAVRLIGWAQKGEKVTKTLINKPGPLPSIDGVSPLTHHNTGVSLSKSPPPGFPPFTAQDRTKFQALFMKSGPANGLLSGEKARDIFVKSTLSNDKLLQIWNLADTQYRGALDSTDFAIAMYFIQGLMSGQLSFIPSSLPPGLYLQASGHNQTSVRSHMTGNSGSVSPLTGAFPQARNNVQPQHTGQHPLLQPDNTGLSAAQSRPSVRNDSSLASPSVPQNGHTLPWDVTAAEKTTADRFFDELDSQRRGYIEGDVAVPFMLKSNLPGDALAQVWDLADMNNDGCLTRDGFAVAMHLIQKKLAGTDIPSTLPPSLLPPSMRAKNSSPFSPSISHSPEAAKDLLGDDTPPPSAVPPQPPRPTPTVTRDPFASSAHNASSHRDLLGDDDDDIARTSIPLHDQSAEIGNVQNQLNSTTRSLDSTKNERVAVEQTLATQASQLSALQTQLSSAKAAYETEAKLLTTLRDRHSAQTAEMQTSREELIRAESDLSALRVEKSEIEGAFLRDKEEARDLHRKMVEVGQQVESLRSEIEKAKKDAKQQKGLLAIAKKQLSSRETEKAKIEKELEEANVEVISVTKEREEAESELVKLPTPLPDKRDLSSDSLTFAASHALPVSPDPSSPAGSVAGKSNNPFERLGLSSGTSSPRSQSPFVPFGEASQPATSAAGNVDFAESANRSSTNDPFGLSQGFQLDSETQPSSDVKEANGNLIESRTSTPRPDMSLESVRSTASTDGSDQYVTPPTTANNNHAQTPVAHNSVSPVQQLPIMEDATSHFPDIGADDAIPGQFPGSPEENRTRETDLAAQLKEIEVDDSDSESDSEDEVSLAELAKTKSQDNDTLAGPPAQGFSVEPKVSFDDVFSVGPAGTSPFPRVDTKDTAVTSILNPSVDAVLANHITSPSEVPTVAGVSAFDEAMGIIPSTAPSSTQNFSFDSAFDDNFDFASATQFPQVPEVPATVPGENKNNHFDNVFTTSLRNQAPASPSHNKPALEGLVPDDLLPKAEPAKPTFDEAFLGFDSGPTLNLNTSFSSPARQVATENPSPTQAAFPASSPPVSPKFNSSPQTGHVLSTPRAKSPPPRVSSPKPRPSTSSSKDIPDKLKEPPTRHSKLNIRLPFGKKKKQQPQEPFPTPSAQLLTPPQEEPYRIVTPASDDDVEAVKQLTGMGFSRTQAVNALESHGYDLQRALNSLLSNDV